METYQDCIELTKEDFDENGHYNGPFTLACLCNADVSIAPDLGSVHIPNTRQTLEEGGLCTNGRITVGRETDICVHGNLCADSLISHSDVYCTGHIEVRHVKCKGKLIAEMDITVTGSFYVAGRIVTPRLVLSSLEIVMPQQYHHEQNLPKKG